MKQTLGYWQYAVNFQFHPAALKLYFGEGSLGYTMSDEVTALTIKGQDLLSLRREKKSGDQRKNI